MNLIRKQKIRFFFLHYILIMIVNFLANFLADPDSGYVSPFCYMLVYEFFILAVIIAPIKETICFQFIPKLILNFIGIKNHIIVLFILGSFFSLLHTVHQTENALFLLFFTIGCFVLVNYYMQVQKRENTKNAIFKTIILHSFINLTTFIVDVVFFY